MKDKIELNMNFMVDNISKLDSKNQFMLKSDLR